MVQTFSQFLTERDKTSPKKTYDFSSVIYLLPDKISKKIYEWGVKKISDEDLFKDPEDPSFGREDEVHCTIMYGIHDKRSASSREILKKTEPFDIKLGKITAFTAPEKFDVLKIDVHSDDLHDLHNVIRDTLDVTETYPEYKPHVTIAYLKKGKSSQYVGSQQFEGVSVKVDKVVFSSSAGVKTPISLMK